MSNYTSNSNSKKRETPNKLKDLKRIIVAMWNFESYHFLHNMKLLWTMLAGSAFRVILVEEQQ